MRKIKTIEMDFIKFDSHIELSFQGSEFLNILSIEYTTLESWYAIYEENDSEYNFKGKDKVFKYYLFEESINIPKDLEYRKTYKIFYNEINNFYFMFE